LILSIKRKEFRKGVSMVELLVLVLIVVILSSVLFPHIQRMYVRGREAAVKSNMMTLNVAAENFAAMADGLYPSYPQDTVGDILTFAGVPTINEYRIADNCPTSASNVSVTQYALLPGNESYRNPFLTVGNCLDVELNAPTHKIVAANASGQGTVYWVPDDYYNMMTERYRIYGDGYNNILPFVISSRL
jgi:Tfp pilus assembly protein PilE